MNEKTNLRPSPIAGTWYSADPQELRNTVDAYIQQAQLPEIHGEVVGLVAPHAGYRYSGAVAGHAFKTVLGNSYDFVAVISPMHQYHPKPLLTSAHKAYQTPLGEVRLAENKLTEINTALTEKTGLSLTPVAKDQEHALEIELPFLQQAIEGGFQLIPIMLRSQSREIARGLGHVLAASLKNESFLLVASSDLSHFHSESTAHQLDERVLSAITDFSPNGLFDLKASGQGQACGLAPIAAVLWAAQDLGAKDVTLLKYDTSASATGDRTSVVGYGAAAITRPS